MTTDKFPFSSLRFFSVAFIVAFLLSSCGLFSFDDEDSDYNLFILGQKNQKEGEYFQAKKAYEKILNNYPDSNVRSRAQLGLADAHFDDAHYFDAELAYGKFIEMYPNNPHIDKAYFYKGMSHFMQINDPDQDITQAERCLESFEYIEKHFPRSPYFEKAKEKHTECEGIIAEHTLSIAEFYFQINAYAPVIQRAIEYLTQYNNAPKKDRALYLIATSYEKEDNKRKALGWFKKLVENFPDSDYFSSAQSSIAELEKELNENP